MSAANGVTDAIRVEGVSKRFRYLSIPKTTTLKEMLVRLKFFGARNGSRFIQALDDVNFAVPHGSTLGIIGPNGSGKTTLMRLIAGVYSPDSGRVATSGPVALLSLGNLGLGFHPEFTGRENIRIGALMLGLSPREITSRFDEIVDFAELEEFIDTPVRMYSNGMYLRLAFSVAINVDPDILLLDEVLAVGDQSFAIKCRDRIEQLKRHGKTIILVTHDAYTLLTWCDSVLWLDRGRVLMHGAPEPVIRAYQDQPLQYGVSVQLVGASEPRS